MDVTRILRQACLASVVAAMAVGCSGSPDDTSLHETARYGSRAELQAVIGEAGGSVDAIGDDNLRADLPDPQARGVPISCSRSRFRCRDCLQYLVSQAKSEMLTYRRTG